MTALRTGGLPRLCLVFMILVVFAPLVPLLVGCQRKPATKTDVQEQADLRLSAQEAADHNQAVALMGQFNYEAAYDVLAKLSRAHPDWMDVRVDWAIATLNRRQTGDSEAAQELLESVLQRDPKHLRALYCLGILKLDGGDPQGALVLFERVAAGDPADAYAHYYTGQCFFQVGQVEKALDKFKQTIPLDPYLRSAYYGAFQACLRLGQRTNADEYRKLFERLEGNPQTRLAEIKYTRMGPKATLQAAEVQLSEPSRPSGPLFLDSTALTDLPISWRTEWTQEERPHVTVGHLSDEGPVLLFLAQASQELSDPNVILKRVGSSWEWQKDHPWSSVQGVHAVLWGDYDNDGLTDAYLCRSGPNQLWRQVAPEQWQDVTEATGTSGGEGVTRDGQMFDADHDGDLDLFLAKIGPNELLNNNLDGTFRPLAEEQGLTGESSAARSLVVLDFDRDRDLDLFILNEECPHEAYVNDRLWSYRLATGMATLLSTPIQSIVTADVDADGQAELWSWGSSGLQRWVPNADGEWLPESWSLEGITANVKNVSLGVADFDGDGHSDLLLQHSGGWGVWQLASRKRLHASDEVWVASQWLSHGTQGYARVGLTTQGAAWNPPGPGRFQFLDVRFTGKAEQSDQMRSNRSGIGAWVAARRGARWTSVRTLRSDSFPGQSLQPWAVGLGGQKQLDFIAVTWPDGVYQTEYALAPGKSLTITETQRQVASCPLVFVWDGEAYRFVTDVLGGGGIGFNLARGQYGEPRSTENLLLPAGGLRARDGKLIVKIAEPMEEVCYLDHAQLVRYELSPGWHMTLDERFAVQGPLPTGEPIFYRREMKPIAASNDRGDAVLAMISEADSHAAEPGARDRRFLGRTEPHHVILEFEQPIERDNTWLLMDGWIEYPYSQTMFAAWQAGATYDAPTIEVQATDGTWLPVCPQFGYPAGMPRQAAVPLEGSKIPDGARRLRIGTNMEVYWDRLALVVAETPSDADVQRHEHPLLVARVAEVGYARRELLPQRRPVYDYQQSSPFGDSRHLRGFYSEWGSVLGLVSEEDDATAIIGPGEEIHLEFADSGDASTSQSIAAGAVWVLELNGWCKDMDLYTKDGETVEPLPKRVIAASSATEASELKRRSLVERHRWRYRGGN